MDFKFKVENFSGEYIYRLLSRKPYASKLTSFKGNAGFIYLEFISLTDNEQLDLATTFKKLQDPTSEIGSTYLIGRSQQIVDTEKINGVNRLKVDSLISNNAASPLFSFPTMAGGLKVFTIEKSVDVQSSYSTIHRATDGGFLLGFILKLSNDKATVKLSIDFEVIFEIPVTSLGDLYHSSDVNLADILIYTSPSTISARFPERLYFNKELLIQVKKSDTSSVKVDKFLIATKGK